MLKIYEYRLPFSNPFRVSERTYSHREGIILEYHGANHRAYGEIAPLPGFSKETLQQIKVILFQQKDILQTALSDGSFPQIIEVFEKIHRFPSLSFGMDMLWTDLKAKKQDMSFTEALGLSNASEPKVNFTVGLDQNDISKMVTQKVRSGFDTLKLKAGKDFDGLLRSIRTIHEDHPELKFRIDPNESWSVDECIIRFKQMEGLNIEYVEQPVSHKSENAFAQIRTSSNISLAADESLRNKSDAKTLSVGRSVDYFIIKPALFGRIQDIIVTKRMADSHNIKVVFTTTLDSLAGRMATAELASVLGNKNIAHGLDTGNWFEKDISVKKEITEAHYRLGNSSGLDIDLDTSSLKEIC